MEDISGKALYLISMEEFLDIRSKHFLNKLSFVPDGYSKRNEKDCGIALGRLTFPSFLLLKFVKTSFLRMCPFGPEPLIPFKSIPKSFACQKAAGEAFVASKVFGNLNDRDICSDYRAVNKKSLHFNLGFLLESIGYPQWIVRSLQSKQFYLLICDLLSVSPVSL